MTKKQFRETVAKAELFMSNYKAKGQQVSIWECPCCKKENDTPKPTKALLAPGRRCWDSSKMCVHCGAVSFVQVFTRRKYANFLSQMTAPIIKPEKTKH